jgi:UDP-glucose 4-epimerase
MIAKSRNCKKKETIFCATRYGNVMTSRGSVIPLFVDLIKSEKPITITDPNMTRFLMSLDESVKLVLHAFEHGKQGDIFIQKAPASTILDLAEALKKLFKARNHTKIIGTRHGEKLFESLLSREEMAVAKENGSYFRIPIDNRDLNYEKYFIKGQKNISFSESYTSHNTKRLGVKELIKLLKNIDFIKKELDA